MEEQACSDNPVLDQIRFQTHQMLYRNVRNRLCRQIEVLSFDFLEGHHDDGAHYLQRYHARPVHYVCRQRIGFIGQCILESHYLVVAGKNHVVALRDPDQARMRKQAFLSVLEGGVFLPYLDGSPTDFWQEHIEPVRMDSSNVLPGHKAIEVPVNILFSKNNTGNMQGMRMI